MLAIAKLTDAIVAAGIPITGLSGTREACRLADDNKHLTRQQREAAEAMIVAFDWSEPGPVKPRADLEAIFAKADPAWLLRLLAADFCERHPERGQALLEAMEMADTVREGK